MPVVEPSLLAAMLAMDAICKAIARQLVSIRANAGNAICMLLWRRYEVPRRSKSQEHIDRAILLREQLCAKLCEAHYCDRHQCCSDEKGGEVRTAG